MYLCLSVSDVLPFFLFVVSAKVGAMVDNVGRYGTVGNDSQKNRWKKIYYDSPTQGEVYPQPRTTVVGA